MSYLTNRKNHGTFRIEQGREMTCETCGTRFTPPYDATTDQMTMCGECRRIDEAPQELVELLQRHIYSYRDYNVGEFADAYRKFPEFQVAIRTKYRSLESGRIDKILDATHKLVASLDPDERMLFKERNPALWEMMNEWAVTEDLGEF